MLLVRKLICAQNIYQMPYFSSEPRSSRGDIHHYPQESERAAFAIRTFPRSLCQLPCGMIQHRLWKLPWERSGQPWIISFPLHISLLMSLEYRRKIIPCIFVKNTFPDGIRQYWSQSRPPVSCVPWNWKCSKNVCKCCLQPESTHLIWKAVAGWSSRAARSTRTLIGGLKTTYL